MYMQISLKPILDFMPQLMLMLVTAALTWLATHKKQRTELLKLDDERVKAIVDLWQGICEDLRQEVKTLSGEVGSLRQENRGLKTDIHKLEKLINEKTN